MGEGFYLVNSDKVQKLEDVFRVVFELPAAADVRRLLQNDDEKWDSLAHVKLVAALESEFNLNLDTADALRIKSFETARELLEERGW